MRAPDPTTPTEWQIKLAALDPHLSVKQIALQLGCSLDYVVQLRDGTERDPRASVGDVIRGMYAAHVAPRGRR